MKTAERKAVDGERIQATLSQFVAQAPALSRRPQRRHRRVAQAQAKPERTVGRNTLLHRHRVLPDGGKIFRPRFTGMDVEAVGQMQRRMLVQLHGFLSTDFQRLKPA